MTAPQVKAGIEALKRAALATGLMQEPISVDTSARAALLACGSRSGAGAQTTLQTARSTRCTAAHPPPRSDAWRGQAHATGATATSRDFNDSTRSHAPIVFAFVLGLAFVLLLVTFRSIVIPIKAIVPEHALGRRAYGVPCSSSRTGGSSRCSTFGSFEGVTL